MYSYDRTHIAAWKPWVDDISGAEGFTLPLVAKGRKIGRATMKKGYGPLSNKWFCALYFGGGAPVVTGEGDTPARASADARKILEKAISVVR